MKLSRLFNSLPKRIAAATLVFLAFALPAASMAADTVKLESTLGLANVTAGDDNYKPSINASYDQVVKVQVYYHNQENPDSGKIANNLRVKINIPTSAGTTQTVASTVSADNANTVNRTATVTLNRSDASLQYIPGSAVWRHNTGTNENVTYVDTKLSDDIVMGGQGLVLENEKPCFNFSASVTVLARVMVPGVSVNKQVRLKGTTAWATSVTAKAGDTVQYMISYKNTGNANQYKVVVRDNMPPKISYVPGTTYLKNGANPNGVLYNSDAVTTNGIVVGDYAPGGAGYVMFDAKIPAEDQLTCGDNMFRNVGIAKPENMNEYYNTADVNVNRKCETPKPSYSCDLLTLAKKDDRAVTATVTHSQANGATYKSTTINWGDGTTNESTSHTYAKDGTYNIVATVNFLVNGETKSATSDNCKASVTIKTPQKPVYSCDLLSLTQGANRAVTASVAYTAQGGATLKAVTFNWGDNTTPLVTDKTTAQHQYAADGTYTVTARILFSVDGKDVYAADNAACVKQVSFTTTPPVTPPSELPNTGAGNVIGIFAAAVVTGTIGFRLFLSRKLAARR